MNLKSLGLCAALLWAATSCKKDYDPVPPHLAEIYPIMDGGVRTYYVRDTVFNTSVDSFGTTYWKRELTDGTETDLLDREVSKLYIYTSADSTDSLGNPVINYEYTDLWTQYADDFYAERIEGNIRYLVLPMPPVEGSRWNGNLYNADGTQTYRVINDDSTVTLRGKQYEHCVVVEQQEPRYTGADEPGRVIWVEEFAYEIYAPGIGKIARYYKSFSAQRSSGTGPWSIDADSRFYYEELESHNY